MPMNQVGGIQEGRPVPSQKKSSLADNEWKTGLPDHQDNRGAGGFGHEPWSHCQFPSETSRRGHQNAGVK